MKDGEREEAFTFSFAGIFLRSWCSAYQPWAAFVFCELVALCSASTVQTSQSSQAGMSTACLQPFCRGNQEVQVTSAFSIARGMVVLSSMWLGQLLSSWQAGRLVTALPSLLALELEDALEGFSQSASHCCSGWNLHSCALILLQLERETSTLAY